MPEDWVSPDMACDQAFAAIAAACCAEIDAQLAICLASDDPAGPHKARVALRRLTTALDAFAPILRRGQAAGARARAKRIFRVLGKLRDADVYLADHAGDADRARLQGETAALRQKTRKALRQSRAVAMAPALMRQLATGGLMRRRPRGLQMRAAPVGDLARAALDRAWARVQAPGAALEGLGEEARHEFRKDMKTLRYLAEFFAPLWPGPGAGAFRETLQQVQDDLGLLNDLANARRRGGATDPGQEARALAGARGHWQRLTDAPAFWAVSPSDAPPSGRRSPS